MNRSLSFLIDLKSTTNNYNAIDITEDIIINEISKTDNSVLKTETIQNTYSLYPSQFNNNTFIDYRGFASDKNTVINNTVDNDTYDISEASIIKWSQKYPSIRLKPADLAYLKDVFVYPCNRLAVLRRFDQPTYHNIFDMNSSPISTMVSYIKPDENDLMEFNFGENWEIHKSGLLGVINDVIGISNVKLPTFQGTSNLFESIVVNVGSALGITTSNNNPLGNPNIIHEAPIRKVGSDFEGLNFSFKYNFNTTYLIKYNNEIDPNIAFLDIIANGLRMGTSPSDFIVTPAFANDVKKIMNKVMNGDLEALIVAVINGVTEFLKVAIEKIVGVTKKVAQDVVNGEVADAAGELFSVVTTLIKTTLSKYKWQLTGAVSSMAGLPTTPWHLTLGNPKSPIFSMGNLLIENGINMKLSKDFMFNDLPDSITYEFTLKNGRRMGAQELEILFNRGYGRIYHNYSSINNNKKIFERLIK